MSANRRASTAIGLDASQRELAGLDQSGVRCHAREWADPPNAKYISTLSRLSLYAKFYESGIAKKLDQYLRHTHLTSRNTLVVDTTMADMQLPHNIPSTGMNASGVQNGLYPN